MTFIKNVAWRQNTQINQHQSRIIIQWISHALMPIITEKRHDEDYSIEKL